MKTFKKLLVLYLLLTLSSCQIGKELFFKKNATHTKEEIITKTYKKGDTVTFIVPNVKYKDTTIVTYNRTGTAVSARYDVNGLIDKIRCIEKETEQWRIEKRESEEKEKLKEKEEKVKTTLSFEIIIALIIVGFGFIAYLSISRKTKAITKVLDGLLDQTKP